MALFPKDSILIQDDFIKPIFHQNFCRKTLELLILHPFSASQENIVLGQKERAKFCPMRSKHF